MSMKAFSSKLSGVSESDTLFLQEPLITHDFSFGKKSLQQFKCGQQQLYHHRKSKSAMANIDEATVVLSDDEDTNPPQAKPRKLHKEPLL